MSDLLLAAFRLEAIGDNVVASCRLAQQIAEEAAPGLGHYLGPKGFPRPWVAQITGACPRYGFQRKFQRARKCYAQSNSVGSRGVYYHYLLPAGVYEVNDLVGWGRQRRYFIRVEEGRWTEISKEEAAVVLPGNAPSE